MKEANVVIALFTSDGEADYTGYERVTRTNSDQQWKTVVNEITGLAQVFNRNVIKFPRLPESESSPVVIVSCSVCDADTLFELSRALLDPAVVLVPGRGLLIPPMTLGFVLPEMMSDETVAIKEALLADLQSGFLFFLYERMGPEAVKVLRGNYQQAMADQDRSRAH